MPPSTPSALLQTAAGVVTFNGTKFYEYKANGLVKDVFQKQEQLDKLKGAWRPARVCVCACVLVCTCIMRVRVYVHYMCVCRRAAVGGGGRR